MMLLSQDTSGRLTMLNEHISSTLVNSYRPLIDYLVEGIDSKGQTHFSGYKSQLLVDVEEKIFWELFLNSAIVAHYIYIWKHTLK